MNFIGGMKLNSDKIKSTWGILIPLKTSLNGEKRKQRKMRKKAITRDAIGYAGA